MYKVRHIFKVRQLGKEVCHTRLHSVGEPDPGACMQKGFVSFWGKGSGRITCRGLFIGLAVSVASSP